MTMFHFTLRLGEVINVNRRFDLRERFRRVCARTMALALESDLQTVISEVARGMVYHLKEKQLSAIEKFEMSLYPCQQGLENPLSTDFYPQYN